MKGLEGRKTYLGLIIALIGVFGLAKYITPEEATLVVNHIFEIVGIAIALYGRIVTKPKAQ